MTQEKINDLWKSLWEKEGLGQFVGSRTTPWDWISPSIGKCLNDPSLNPLIPNTDPPKRDEGIIKIRRAISDSWDPIYNRLSNAFYEEAEKHGLRYICPGNFGIEEEDELVEFVEALQKIGLEVFQVPYGSPTEFLVRCVRCKG